MRATHTYAILQVPRNIYDVIHGRLEEAGYSDQFHEDGVIDMHGIAIQPDPPDEGDEG